MCGSCTMCCKTMSVRELGKSKGTWCEHCKIGQGCAIYEERPHGCQVWNCLWILRPDLLPEDDERPDRLGVVYWLTNMPSVTKDPTATRLYLGRDEGKTGALKKKATQRATDHIVRLLEGQVASPAAREVALAEEAAGHGAS